METKENGRQLTGVLRTLLGFAVKYLGILAGAALAGILLLTASYLLPINRETKEASLEYSYAMGWAPLVNNRYAQYTSFFTTYEPGILDDATDSIILNKCFDEGEGSALKRAAYMNGYSRYWHGYVAVLRPIFYFVDYWDWLLINSFLQLLLMGCVGYGVYKVTGKKRYLLAFFSCCVFLTPAATGMSLQYSPCFYISMLGSLLCLLKTDWLLRKNRSYYLFLLLGIATCYFDFLTYPLVCFALPFCWLVVAAGKKLELKSQLALLFGGGISFLVGYGGFFFAKWIVQAVVCGNGNYFNGLGNVIGYISSVGDDYRLLHQNYCRIDSMYNNFRHYLYPAFVVILVGWMGIFLYRFFRGSLKVGCENVILLAVTLTGPAWYLIVNTHTAYHHLFTYRNNVASLLGFMLFVCSAMDAGQRTRATVRTYLQRGVVLAVCLGVGVSASRLAKEDRTAINGGDNTELLLSEGEALEVEFTPSVECIKGFSLLFRTKASADGEIRIELRNEGGVCEEAVVLVEEYENSTLSTQLVDWRLNAGEQYVLRVSLEGNADGIYILVTPEGEKPQPEYGAMYLNGEPLGDIAPLSCIVYRGHMQTKAVKLYLSVCSAVLVLSWILTVRAGLAELRAGNGNSQRERESAAGAAGGCLTIREAKMIVERKNKK